MNGSDPLEAIYLLWLVGCVIAICIVVEELVDHRRQRRRQHQDWIGENGARPLR